MKKEIRAVTKWVIFVLTGPTGFVPNSCPKKDYNSLCGGIEYARFFESKDSCQIYVDNDEWLMNIQKENKKRIVFVPVNISIQVPKAFYE